MNAPVFSNLVEGSLFCARYRIAHLIRSGNMGAVYQVLDEKTDTPRALKVMLPSLLDDADLRERFEREAKVTGPIASDHIVKVTDAGIDATLGIPFLVMELLQGRELGGLLKERGGLSKEEIVTYLYQAALALDKTHAAGIVHRDLKPENLFLTYRDDGSPCVKILDFGIAKLVIQGVARSTRAMGTPLYMAPEQIRGDKKIGPRTDIYALGHVAYALFSGSPYWDEETRNAESIIPVLAEIMKGPKEAPSARALRQKRPAVPPAFDDWFFKTAAADTDDRFERATDAIRDLGEALRVPVPKAAWLVPAAGAPVDAKAPEPPFPPPAATPLAPPPLVPPPLVVFAPEEAPQAPAALASPVPAIEPSMLAHSATVAVPPVMELMVKTTLLDNPAVPVGTVTDGFVPPVRGDVEPVPNTARLPEPNPGGSGAVLAAAATKPDIRAPERSRWPLVAVPLVLIGVGIAFFQASNSLPDAGSSPGAAQPVAITVEVPVKTLQKVEPVPSVQEAVFDAGAEDAAAKAPSPSSSFVQAQPQKSALPRAPMTTNPYGEGKAPAPTKTAAPTKTVAPTSKPREDLF